MQDDSKLTFLQRREAFKIHRCPSIGLMWFVSFNLARHNELFARLVDTLSAAPPTTVVSEITIDRPSSVNKQEPLFLDIGYCLGQDIRTLRAAGAPGHRLVGTELEKGFTELSHGLFRDKVTLGAAFLEHNIMDDLVEGKSDVMTTSRGKITVVHLGSLLHSFSIKEQTAILAEKLIGVFGSRVEAMLRNDEFEDVNRLGGGEVEAKRLIFECERM